MKSRKVFNSAPPDYIADVQIHRIICSLLVIIVVVVVVLVVVIVDFMPVNADTSTEHENQTAENLYVHCFSIFTKPSNFIFHGIFSVLRSSYIFISRLDLSFPSLFLLLQMVSTPLLCTYNDARHPKCFRIENIDEKMKRTMRYRQMRERKGQNKNGG